MDKSYTADFTFLHINLDYSIHMTAQGHLYRIIYLLKATNAYLFGDLFVEMFLLCSLASATQMDSKPVSPTTYGSVVLQVWNI